VDRLVAELNRRGIDTLIDGAHAPGMLSLNIPTIGRRRGRKRRASYYTGNLHKWSSAPNGAAFLYVRRDRQPLIRPLIVSHGANSKRPDASASARVRLHATMDLSACSPSRTRSAFMASLVPADGRR